MTVVLFFEWDNPLDDEKMNKYRKFTNESTFWKEKVEEGLVKGYSTFADTASSRHIMGFFEFEDWGNLSKVMGSKEFHDGTRRFSYIVDNLRYRLLRPTVPV